MAKQLKEKTINRGTGLLIIDVINSNPNGDPDRESDPRQRSNQHGEITPVSFKRKVRDLVEQKEGPVWQSLEGELKLDPEQFMISESRETDMKDMRKLNEDQFIGRFWDGRIFGNTELEKGREIPVKTGVVQFGLGISVSPVTVERMTTTNPAVQADKTRGMAPLAFRIIHHGIYCMPFFINPTAAHKSGCTPEDINLLLRIIPFAYKHTASYIRSNVDLIHAWYIEHNSPLGSCSDFDLLSDLTPRKLQDPDKPSMSRAEYYIPTAKDIREELVKKVHSVRDLMEEI